MKKVRHLTGSQKELLDLKGREILSLNRQLQVLQKAGVERVYRMKIELGIVEKDLSLWQLEPSGERFIGPDMPVPKKDFPGRNAGKEKPETKSEKEEEEKKENSEKEEDLKKKENLNSKETDKTPLEN